MLFRRKKAQHQLLAGELVIEGSQQVEERATAKQRFKALGYRRALLACNRGSTLTRLVNRRSGFETGLRMPTDRSGRLLATILRVSSPQGFHEARVA